jgi:CRP-like cAMP-binding protein
MSSASVVAAIAETPLFKCVSADDRARLAAVSQLRSFARGQRIFDLGDPSDMFFVVVRGFVKVFRPGLNGQDVILEMFGAGSPLGAIAHFQNKPFPASAAAIDETDCLAIPRAAFFKLLESEPALVRGLLGSLSLRLVQLTTRLEELSGGRVDVRFARLFLKLAEQMGVPSPDGIRIPIALSRQELADLLGTTIETTIRTMSRWSKDEVMRTEKDGFVILDRAALDAMAAG